MTESTEPEPRSPSALKPERHGAQWTRDEVEKLIEEIQEGLTLSELAERHQRTAGGITGLVMRLLPQALRPDSRVRCVVVLAQYLRENTEITRQSLVVRFRSAPSGPSSPKTAERPHDLAMRPSVDDCLARLTATNSPEVGRAQVKSLDTGLESTINHIPDLADDCLDVGDVGMLVSVAVARLPRDRDRKVLGMRLGINGQPRTFAEIGQICGLSRERVRQIQERALTRAAQHAHCEGTPGYILNNLLKPLRDDNRAMAAWVLEGACGGFEIPPRLAAKFILRSAGYSKEKTEEILDLLPTITSGKRVLKPGKQERDCGPKSVKYDVTFWLEHADWPDVIAPPPPVAELSACRTVNESDIAGSFHSHKLDRSVQYESNLELGVLMVLEHSEQISHYQEQPAQIPYTFKGRKRTYYPDVFAATTDGRSLLIEVKPTDRMVLSINRAKADAARAWAHSQGWGWLIVNDKYTFSEIEGHTVPSELWALLDRELKERGALTWRDMLSFRTQYNLDKLDFNAYIVQSGASLDSSYRVMTRDSEPFQ